MTIQKTAQMRRKPFELLLLAILPFAGFFLLRVVKEFYRLHIAPYILPCPLRTLTGLRCPGCGLTHSVYALSRLDFAEMLRENAILPYLLLLALLFYLELWCKAVGHPKQLIPRKNGFLYGSIAGCLIYAVLRNLIGGI